MLYISISTVLLHPVSYIQSKLKTGGKKKKKERKSRKKRAALSN